MEETFAELSKVLLTKSEVRWVVVIALVHKKEKVDNKTIARTLGVKMRTIHHTCKNLEESKDLEELSQGVQSFWRTIEI